MKEENNQSYIVYPSWAKLSYSWEALPNLFKTPLDTDYLDKTSDYEDFGWVCDDSIDYELLNGSFGGGIIKIESNLLQKAPLFLNILTSEANVRAPHEIGKITSNVRYIEPYQRNSLEINAGLKQCKLYTCYIGIKDVHISQNKIFWALRFNVGHKISTKQKQQILAGLNNFDIDADFIESLHGGNADELEGCLKDGKCDHQWLQLSNNYDLNFIIAVMIYISYSLAKIIGCKFKGSILMV